MDKSEVIKKIEELQEWIKTQPQLPQNIDKCFLKLFVTSRNGDMEVIKSLLEDHFKYRLKHEHIFLKRDPLDKSTQLQLETESLLQLPGNTANNYKMFLNRLNDYDPANYTFDEVIKTFFLMSDLFSTDNQDYDGEMVVYDMAGVTWRHQLKASMATIRIFLKTIQDIYPLRLKQIHIINATPLLDMLVRLTRPLMNNDFFNLLHIHLPNSEKLYEHFPRDLLPDEYGGKAGKLSDIRQYWMDQLLEKRDYLMDESRIRMYKPSRTFKNKLKIYIMCDLLKCVKFKNNVNID